MKYLSHPIRIVLADDYPIFRKGFKTLIDQYAPSKINILAEAGNGKELVQAVENHKPDVVITDIRMPLMDGMEATRIISQRFTATAVIALSMSADKNTVLSMYQAGAKGYLLKEAEHTEVLNAIETVYRGDTYFCSTTSAMLASLYGLDKPGKSKTKTSFSDKEVKIIQLICKQFTTKQIAGMLKLSIRTIDDHRYKIQEKMQVKNMVGIALYAVKNEIVTTGEIELR
jgi:DNA-binding NarL/FixJ family response regulator